MAVCFALCSFALNYSLELRYDRLGVLDQYDVLFDTDPYTRLLALSDGHVTGRCLAHPNFSNFLNPPIRIAAKIVYMSGLSSLPELEVRRPISLLVAPLASALNVLLICIFFSRQGFSTLQIVLLALLTVLSFSQMVFGSVPDHFAVSNTCIILLYFLVVDAVRRDGNMRGWAWLTVGVVTMGITVTNLVIVGILLAVPVVYVRRRVLGPILRTGAVLVLIVAINVAVYFAMIAVFHVFGGSRAYAVSWVTSQFSEEEPLDKLARSPDAIAHSIAPPGFKVVDHPQEHQCGGKYDVMVTLQGTSRVFSVGNLLGTATILLMVGGTVMCLWRGGMFRVLAICSVLVMAYNLIFHAIWGDEYFLYSQHWYFASLVCLSGMMLCRGHLRSASNAVLAVFVLCVAINNGVRMSQILTALEALG